MVEKLVPSALGFAFAFAFANSYLPGKSLDKFGTLGQKTYTKLSNPGGADGKCCGSGC